MFSNKMDFSSCVIWIDFYKSGHIYCCSDYMNLEWVVMHLPGLLTISLIIIKGLNFIIPVLHGDWLEVVYLKVMPGAPYCFLCM